MTPRTINALFAIAAFTASSCAIFEPRWEVVAPPMTPAWFQVSAEQMRALCPDDFACVRRKFEARTCLIFTPATRESSPQFVIDHEETKHCIEGKNHD